MRFFKIIVLSFFTLLFILPSLIACGTGQNTGNINVTTALTSSDITKTSMQTTSTSNTTILPTYSKYTVFTRLNEEFTITIGAAYPGYLWEADYEKTKFQKIGESVFIENRQAEINPFNNMGSRIFTFKALKTGTTQINIVHRPVTDQGSLDYAEMSLWQEFFTIIVE